MHPAVFGLSSIAGAVLVTIALGSAPQPVAGGADLTVTHFDDPAPNGCTAGHCTLREAVIEANGNANADTIILNEGTYSLGTSPATDDPAEDSSLSGDLDISEGDLTIVGAGKNKTTIDAQQKDRAFEITAGEFSGITVELKSLTVANGRVDAPTAGAIANTFTTSHLKLTNSIVRDSEVFGNIAPCGGAIFNVGELTINGSELYGNDAQIGGALCSGGTVSITRSTIRNNKAGEGAGLYFGEAQQVTISRSTINANTASNRGGGILVSGSTVVVKNSTINGNSAPMDAGGGVYVHNGGSTAVRSSTITKNTSDSGAGIEVLAGGALTLHNSIVADNPGGPDCTGTVTSLGFNLGGDATCVSEAGSDNANENPMLGLLKGNGGPTKTRAPSAASPAVDTGDNTGDCPDLDQRGKNRPKDGDGNGSIRCDRGAVERTSATQP